MYICSQSWTISYYSNVTLSGPQYKENSELRYVEFFPNYYSYTTKEMAELKKILEKFP